MESKRYWDLPFNNIEEQDLSTSITMFMKSFGIKDQKESITMFIKSFGIKDQKEFITDENEDFIPL